MYPGWKSKEIVRDAMLLAGGGSTTPEDKVREARGTLISAVLLALLMSTLLSLYMARTIVLPLRMLAMKFCTLVTAPPAACRWTRLPMPPA